MFANTDLEVTNKYTGDVATRVALADAEVIDKAIAAAEEAQPAMTKMTPYERQAVLDHCIKRFEVNDPQQVVIDEIVAQSLVLLCVPLEVMTYLIGFLLFRVFDIFKPWPISWSERAIKGGLGIMVDDILAAIYTLPFLYLISYLIGY